MDHGANPVPDPAPQAIVQILVHAAIQPQQMYPLLRPQLPYVPFRNQSSESVHQVAASIANESALSQPVQQPIHPQPSIPSQHSIPNPLISQPNPQAMLPNRSDQLRQAHDSSPFAHALRQAHDDDAFRQILHDINT